MILIKFLCFLIYLGYCDAKIFYYQPQAVHLSLGGKLNYPNRIRVDYLLRILFILENYDEMIVTWSTFDDPGDSIVEYGINGFALTVSGTRELFIDGGNEGHSQFIHKVVLKELQPDMKYIYHCGSNMGWSAEFFFKTLPSGNDWKPRIALYGDMGNENSQSMPRLQEETQRGFYDAIIHVGDFG